MNTRSYYERYWSEEGFCPRGTLTPQLRRLYETYLPSGGRILDLGCGDGRTSGPWLRDQGFQYVGVDVSKNAVGEARELGLEAHLIDDAGTLPFESDTFDAIVCIEVLEHLFEPNHAVAEAYRVLRPGGVLVASVPNVAYWRRRIDLLGGRWNPFGDEHSVDAPWRDPHIRFFTRAAMRRMVLRAGFSPVHVSGHGGSLIRDLPRIGRLVGSNPDNPLYRVFQSAMPALLGVRLDVAAYKLGIGT